MMIPFFISNELRWRKIMPIEVFTEMSVVQSHQSNFLKGHASLLCHILRGLCSRKNRFETQCSWSWAQKSQL